VHYFRAGITFGGISVEIRLVAGAVSLPRGLFGGAVSCCPSFVWDTGPPRFFSSGPNPSQSRILLNRPMLQNKRYSISPSRNIPNGEPLRHGLEFLQRVQIRSHAHALLKIS